jgi:hypothetical protein
MTLDDRVQSLKSKHALLEHEIAQEIGRPFPDDMYLHDLKRRKLRIKDEIARIETVHLPA